ncbi:unnamed protein product, partial [Ectocarpus sp. 13 AM-2016]
DFLTGAPYLVGTSVHTINAQHTTQPQPVPLRTMMLRVVNRLCQPSGWKCSTAASARLQLPPTAAETYRQSGTFVSKHHVLEQTDVVAFLDQRSMEFRVAGGEVVVKECPFCHDTGGKADNMWKLYIGLNNGGAWMCHRCAASGSWYDLKRRAGSGGARFVSQVAMPRSSTSTRNTLNPRRTRGEEFHVTQQRAAGLRPIPDEQRARSYPTNLLHNPRFDQVMDYLSGTEPGQRGIKKEVLVKYGVGCAVYKYPGEAGYVEAQSITFPWIVNKKDIPPEEVKGLEKFVKDKYGEKSRIPDAVTVRVKARAVRNKQWQRLDPAGGRWGIFGLHTVPDNATEVVLTEGEYDAMAVYQATGKPAVSLPNGASSLPLEVLPFLERFNKIFLWMDHDGAGQAGVDKFVLKLGTRRCLVVRPLEDDPNPPKDANEALLAGRNLQEFLDGASSTKHDDIQTFQDLRQDVIHELQNPLEYSGTGLQSFPRFTRIIKGLRRGELTVLTGPTGSGKTTILSQLSLDLAAGGLSTLWGSFEIKNTRLMQKMLHQFAGRPVADLAGSPESLRAVADRFQALPLSFLRFHGGTHVDEVIDAMDYAVYANDVQHIILDNLQFMLTRNSREGQGGKRPGPFDKFDAQDIALDKFRKFATEHNVHITLVIHPRKEDEGYKLTTSSIFGSAKATQEADLVVILQ